MTEKALNSIELGVVTILSVGVDYVVDKTIKKAIDPKTIPEKFLTGIGILGVNFACNRCIYGLVHNAMHPYEIKKYEMLVEENIKVIETNSEVAKVMAEHEIKVENAVDDIYKKIMEGKV